VVILREATERDEGAAMLAGTDPDRVVAAAEAWLEGTLPPPNPSQAFGDGFAALRIVDGLLGRPVDEFAPNRLAPTPWSARIS
jgi:UDP-N-acetylglucosamine 2-epimerase (non-hydrolysing)